MVALLIAVLLAVFSIVAAKAGKKGVGLIAGIASILVFIGWLKAGIGFDILDWLNDPSVDVPSVDINQ